jgi:hypothetical protein
MVSLWRGVFGVMIMSTGRDISEPQSPLLFIQQVICERDTHGDDDAGWENSTHPPELSGNPTSRDIWKQVGGMEGLRILRIQYPRYVNASLTCCKILRHVISSFTSHLKESVLWNFIALKNPSPRPGLNPWSLGPVASTLTTTPPRRIIAGVVRWF